VRRGSVVAVMAAVTAAVVFAGAACSDDRPAATIDDPAFVRRANAVCAGSVPALRPPERGDSDTTALTARRLHDVAAGLEDVAERLRDVPVSTGAADQVDAWLDDWDRFVAVGRRYAEAVEADDPERQSEIDDEAVVLARRMGRFARGNRIDDCVL
jgi:hypothetical protein